VLKLPKALEAEFWQELQVYEESRKMPYITSVERIGYERGQKEGRQEGKVLLLVRQLTRKFGSLPDSTIDRINHLSSPQVEALGDAIFDLTTIEDLTQWLAAQ
jgi:predicted transposase YdaD